jgi:hypothetical protein
VDNVSVPFLCGVTATKWQAALERVGSFWIFSRFTLESGAVVENQDATARKALLRRRLNDLLSTRPGELPPAASAEVRQVTSSLSLTSRELSFYGFKCPGCDEHEVLICTAPECRRLSCFPPTDAARRVVCFWCGTTYRVPEPGEPTSGKTAPIEITASQTTRAVVDRQLGAGNDGGGER